ncbi:MULTISPECIES: cytochrome P450 [Streptomyces]|uniref:Cytochrome P450 n=1 Tax=Streptomyces coacervatus TaxID=647381 RepID=A0ABP7JEE9_9ACTN|nr:cytochrome P450 [Streptomyces coacervatus]MDF2264283.1 cytochrome P450 [Streptomyces coacervatus]
MSSHDSTGHAGPEVSYCPYPQYAQLREQGVAFVEEANAFMVTRADDIDAVLRDVETFSSLDALGLPPIEPGNEPARTGFYLITSDPPEHTGRRRLAARAFTSRRIAPFEPQIRAMSTELIEGLRGRDEVDFVADFAVKLPIAVIATVLGVPEADTAEMRRLSEKVLAFLTYSPDLQGFIQACEEFGALLAPALEAAAGVEEETTILHTIAASGLDAEDATRFVLELLFAGNVTTADAISSGARLLAEDPPLADQLRQDPSRLAPFLEELLRLESPVQGLYRTATRDTELGGTPIPAGARLLVSFGAGNRDAKLAERPDEIDLDRVSPHAHLAFGRGEHTCLGHALARLEARTALEVLLRTVPRFELAIPPERLDYQPGLNVRHLQSLPLRLHWS